MTVQIGYPTPLSFERAIELATEVVAEVGTDYVYPFDRDGEGKAMEVCVYVDQGRPACFVARILHRHGVPVAVLREWEGINAGYMHLTGRLPSGQAIPTPALTLDRRTSLALDSLQSFQDSGTTWANALAWTLNGIKPFPSTAIILEA